MPFPVEEKWIGEAERKLGCNLPPELRARLQRDNGGEIEAVDEDWYIHPVWDPTSRKTMGRTANHIVRETERVRDWRGFPADAVSLAADGQGNHLIVKRDASTVLRWDHETGLCSAISVKWG